MRVWIAICVHRILTGMLSAFLRLARLRAHCQAGDSTAVSDSQTDAGNGVTYYVLPRVLREACYFFNFLHIDVNLAAGANASVNLGRCALYFKSEALGHFLLPTNCILVEGAIVTSWDVIAKAGMCLPSEDAQRRRR